VDKPKDKENNNIIAERLRILRDSTNLTQAEFAKMFAVFFNQDHVYPTYIISKWEHGTLPNKKTLKCIARFYNVSFEYLSGISDEMDYILPQREINLPQYANEISLSELSNYNNMPLFVVTEGQFPNCWCIYNAEKNSIVTLNMNYPVSLNMRFYTFPPYNTKVNVFSNALSLAKLKDKKDVFVVAKGYNFAQHTIYNGWYHHNETHTALINDRGNVLLYSDLNILYTAH